MFTKKITIIFRSVFILFCNIVSQSFADSLPKPTRPIFYDQKSYRKIDPTFKSRQVLDDQSQEKSDTDFSDRDFSDADVSGAECFPTDIEKENVVFDAAQYHWDVTDMMQRMIASSLVARKALLDKLIQTNRKIFRMRQSVGTSKKEVRPDFVVVTSEPVFALAAGAIIIEEVVVAAATVATGLYVGSAGQDSQNNPVNAAASKKAETPRPNPTTATTTAKVKIQKPVGVKKQEQSQQQPKFKATPQQTVKDPFKKDIEFSSSNNPNQDAAKKFQAQKAHAAQQRDHVIETMASVVAFGAHQYQQGQKKAKTEKKIAEWSQAKEEDIQRRMREEGKSRWQVEEEDRIFLEKVEQHRIDAAAQKKEKQEEDRRQTEEKKNNNSKKSASNQKSSKGHRTSNSGPDKDPDDDEKNSTAAAGKHPHGIAENNPKHHQNSKGNISKPPRDAQKALDESIKVRDQKYRVSIEDQKFVIFREHSFKRWHGYIIEDFFKLDIEAQKALVKEGLVRSMKSGKIK